MKKIALTSLLAVFAASSAMAANPSNPLYRPGEGRFFSETTLETTNATTSTVALYEKLGYGITDHFAVKLGLGLTESNWFATTGMVGVDLEGEDILAVPTPAFDIAADWRVLDHGAWKMDIYGGYGVYNVWTSNNGFFDGRFLNEDATAYIWKAGVRGGFVGNGWTVAAHAEYDYLNTESFNWDDEGLRKLLVGIDGQLYLDAHWNLVAGAEYNAFAFSSAWDENIGSWVGTLGINYNLCPNSYVGAYVQKTLQHINTATENHADEGKWEVQDGFTFGAKFGIEF